MENLVTILLTKKGFIYGGLVGSMKLMKDIRDDKFKLVKSLTDLTGSVLIGYASYEVISLTDVSEIVRVLWTLFLSANAFLVVSVLSDKDLFDRIKKKYLKI